MDGCPLGLGLVVEDKPTCSYLISSSVLGDFIIAVDWVRLVWV